LLLAGCLATTASSPTSKNNAELFSLGLQNLENKGSTTELKKLTTKKPATAWNRYASSVLKIYSAQQKSIKSLKKKNSTLANENKTLQSNLEKLNQINLELEKRSN
jgi:septal ring factor EnvC (AmiA/AmiB activator)